MAQAALFSLPLPRAARRPFATEDVTRRVVEVAELEHGDRVLELGGASASLLLARELGLHCVVGEQEEAALLRSRELVSTAGLGDRVEVRWVDLEKLPFQDGEFQAVLVQGQVLVSFEAAARRLRRVLEPSEGRLALTYPVRVGRHPASPTQAYWEQRLKEPLRLPRELLELLTSCGYESEDVRTLDDRQLDELYLSLEQHLEGPGAEQVREEIAQHRAQNGRATVSYALAVARRREPGERPFTSRDRG
jgi:hypothetical protein